MSQRQCSDCEKPIRHEQKHYVSNKFGDTDAICWVCLQKREGVQTAWWQPPIPLRKFDWRAFYDEESGTCGWGATEVDAIRDLLEITEEA